MFRRRPIAAGKSCHIEEKMRKTRVSFWIAGVTWPYWAVVLVLIFQDMYLNFPTVGLLMKLLAPVAFIANLTGVGLALASWQKRRSLAGLAAGLNALPIIAVVWFAWWLCFGVKI